MLKTPLCDVLGIDVPIILAAMGGTAFVWRVRGRRRRHPGSMPGDTRPSKMPPAATTGRAIRHRRLAGRALLTAGQTQGASKGFCLWRRLCESSSPRPRQHCRERQKRIDTCHPEVRRGMQMARHPYETFAPQRFRQASVTLPFARWLACVLRPKLQSASRRQRLAAGLSAELPQCSGKRSCTSADDEAGLLDQPLRGSIEMAPAREPAPQAVQPVRQRLRHGSMDRSCSMNSRRPPV